MQNEELRRAQAELDVVRARYFDLYDLAPVGYCTVSESGLILEANLTAANLLGVTREELVQQPWTRFVSKEDQDSYYRHRKQLFAAGEPKMFELHMVKNGATAFWTSLAAAVVQDVEGVPVCRIVISDITERKQEEKFREDVERIVRHDIKGPLLSLFSMAQLAVHGQAEAVLSQMFPQIVQGVRQVIRIVDSAEPLRLMGKGAHEPHKK